MQRSSPTRLRFIFKSTIVFKLFVMLNILKRKSRLRGYFVCSKPSVQRSGALKTVSYEKYEVTKNNHFFKTWFWLTFLGMTCTVVVIYYRNNFQNLDQQVEFSYTSKEIFPYLHYIFLAFSIYQTLKSETGRLPYTRRLGRLFLYSQNNYNQFTPEDTTVEDEKSYPRYISMKWFGKKSFNLLFYF